METLSFTLGILSVIIIAAVIVLVWGTVKVLKHGKQIEENNKWFQNSIDNVWRGKEEDRRVNYEREERLHRELEKRFEDVTRVIDNNHNEVFRSMNDQITDSVTQSKSYTDSRIDKLIDTYFEMKGLNKKLPING